MATRIFELARAMGVTSKMVLDKCRAEGVDIKNHMSSVSAGLEATIREWFSDSAMAGTAIETTKHVDLATARAQAKKARHRRKKKATKPEAKVEPQAEPAEAAEQPPPAGEPEPEPTDQAIAQAAVAEAETPAEADQAQAAPEAETQAPPPEPQAPPEPEPVVPAGPQVVPRPAVVRGPRVVRTERPDVLPVPRPRPRRKPAPAAEPSEARPAAAATPGRRAKRPPTKEEGEDSRQRKRRSPRRRGGRAAESGEGAREWRDQDLLERSERLAAASGGGLRRHRPSVGGKRAAPSAALKAGKVEIEEPVTVKSLSAVAGIKATDIIKKLMGLGVLATINHALDTETAEAVALEFGIKLVVQQAKTVEDEFLEQLEAQPEGKRMPRAPVVTFLGHVDHGKTSLLDRIRRTGVAKGEAGGITQHIGAYRHDQGNQHVVFLDTPGHEAFTAMRARGANMTDVVVLVVAADDGVMPQTVEAVSHARAAEVPIVVALNKIDVPNANVQRSLGQLAEHGLSPQEWGGQTEVIHTSAETGEGLDKLVETLSLEAEILELTAVKEAPAKGFVIESRLDPGRGSVATLLVRSGTLKTGDVLLAGSGYGRVRQMLDDMGDVIEAAGPSTPVEVAGLGRVPEAGDRFHVVETIETARSIAEERAQRSRTETLAVSQQLTLDNLFSRIEAGEITAVPLIVKADVHGSVEAISASLTKLNTDEVKVDILHAAAGGITPGDVALAEASNAIIIGFDVVPTSGARQLAEQQGVDIRMYRVIYELIEDIRKVMEEGLAPEVTQEVLGHAEIRQTFKVSRVGTIGGCFVLDGVVGRNHRVRITRDNVVVEDERELESLKRFKDDVREVRAGMECGLKIAGYEDLKEGDVLEFYRHVEKARTL